MSWQAVKAAADGPRSIKGANLLVLLVLSEWADEDGIVLNRDREQAVAGVSVEMISCQARCARKTVQVALRWLESRGYVAVERGGGAGVESAYRVDIAALEEGRRAEESSQKGGVVTPFPPQKGVVTTPFSGKKGGLMTPFPPQKGVPTPPLSAKKGVVTTPFGARIKEHDLNHEDVVDGGEGMNTPSAREREEPPFPPAPSPPAHARNGQHPKPGPGPGPVPVATPIPAGFSVLPDWQEWARVQFPDLDVGAETEEWLDSMRSNQVRYRYTDWEAAYKSAMRKAARWAAEARGGAGGGGGGKSKQKHAQGPGPGGRGNSNGQTGQSAESRLARAKRERFRERYGAELDEIQFSTGVGHEAGDHQGRPGPGR